MKSLDIIYCNYLNNAIVNILICCPHNFMILFPQKLHTKIKTNGFHDLKFKIIFGVHSITSFLSEYKNYIALQI